MVCTADQIHDLGVEVKDMFFCLEEGVVGECEFATNILNEKLEKEGCKGVIVSGEIGKNPYNTTTHYWIQIPSRKVSDINEGPIIVDPTLDQFNTANASKGLVDIDLGKNLPDVGFFTPIDHEWHWFNP